MIKKRTDNVIKTPAHECIMITVIRSTIILYSIDSSCIISICHNTKRIPPYPNAQLLTFTRLS